MPDKIPGILHRACRLTFRPAITLALLILIAATAPAGAQCPTGFTAITDLIRDTNGDPVEMGSDGVRREHAQVSTQLLSDLGLTYDANEDINPQIRVVVTSPSLPGNITSTANFTIAGVFTDSARIVRVYDEVREDATEPDEESGRFKLFEGDLTIDPTTAQLTVYALAPSSEQITENGSTTTNQRFCEPTANTTNGNDFFFRENVVIETDKRFVVLAPHGGEIEEGTSEEIDPMVTALASHNVDANVWESTAAWHDTSIASEHFHITSDELSTATFPGLSTLLSRTEFASGQAFQYAVSLHGFGKYKGNGIVLGGRVHRELKCLVADRIQQRSSDLGLGAIAFYIWDLDSDDTNNINLPDERGVLITTERPDVGLKGTSNDNIVNRVSPNAGEVYGHGGLQVEQSFPLRQIPALIDLVGEEIGHAYGDLLNNPNLIDPNTTAWCDALQAGPEPPDGEISGRVWNDDGGNGIQDSGEGGMNAITVQLLRDGGLVDSQVTGSDGLYAFTGLPESDRYELRVIAPSGHAFSPASAGSEAVDSDVDAAGRSGEFPLSVDGVVTLDAGLRQITIPCYDTALVAFTSTWRTPVDAGTLPVPANWASLSFDDSAWTERQGTLGYPASDVVSEVPVNALTSYFRLSFEVPDVTLFDTLDLSLFRDDGGIVYLNGVEVLRSNMPSGTVTSTTPASSSSEAIETTSIAASALRAGTNVIAVEIHNRSGSADLSFDFELRSEVCRQCVHEVSFIANRGTYLQSSTVRGSETRLRVDGDTARTTLLSWPISGISTDAQVLHAEIEVEVLDDTSDNFPLYPLLRSWNEAQANLTLAATGDAWQVAGARGDLDRDASRAMGLFNFDEEDVTAYVELNVVGRGVVESWIAGDLTNHGLVATYTSTEHDNGVEIVSDDGTAPPILRVVYASSCQP